MQKKHQVIMLPTNKARNNNQIVLNAVNQMAHTIPYEYEHITLMTNEGAIGNADGDVNGIKRFELYILSDEEIKEGNWVTDNLNIYQCEEEFIAENTEHGKNIPSVYLKVPKGHCRTFHEKSNIKKIIGSSNPELHTCQKCGGEGTIDSGMGIVDCDNCHYKLHKIFPSKIPESFITYYIEQYNKVNVITEVNIEMEQYHLDGEHHLAVRRGIKPKLDKDGSIIINIKQEDEKKYSLEDINNCWDAAMDFYFAERDRFFGGINTTPNKETYIQLLQSK